MNDNQPEPPKQPERDSPSQSPSRDEKEEKARERSSSSSGSSASSSQVEVGEGEDKEKPLVRYKYCCKICKHPDKSKKACVCVVPLSQRRADLGSGCRNCGCLGCSKQDFLSKGEDPEYHPQASKERQGDQKRKQQPEKRDPEKRERPRERSRSLKRKRSSPVRRSKSRSRSPQIIDSFNMKFHNFDRSIIGAMIVNDFQLNPNLLGFAIPQRTYSYIFGRPR